MRFCYALYCAVFSICLTNSAPADAVVGLLIDPATTAGGGATSTRSGVGSWHVYALDTSDESFGISSYNVMMGNWTSIDNRSPDTTIVGSSGDSYTAGFSLLRTASNANPIQASQNLPGRTPFLITGFGQTDSNFTDKATAIDPGAMVIGPTTSGSWGVYVDPLVAPRNGHRWVFLAEGTYDNGGAKPIVSAAVTTAYYTFSDYSHRTTIEVWQGIPEPSTLSLVGFAMAAGLGCLRCRK